MKALRVSEGIVPLGEFKAQAARLIKGLKEQASPLVITQNGRPAAVGFVTPDGCVRISLRGTPGFHIGDLLNACSAHLDGFGGHAGAGGGGIKPGAWDDVVTAVGAAGGAQAGDAANPLDLSVAGLAGLVALPAGRG